MSQLEKTVKSVLMMWSLNKFVSEHNCLLLTPLFLSKSVGMLTA